MGLSKFLLLFIAISDASSDGAKGDFEQCKGERLSLSHLSKITKLADKSLLEDFLVGKQLTHAQVLNFRPSQENFYPDGAYHAIKDLSFVNGTFFLKNGYICTQTDGVGVLKKRCRIVYVDAAQNLWLEDPILFDEPCASKVQIGRIPFYRYK